MKIIIIKLYLTKKGTWMFKLYVYITILSHFHIKFKEKKLKTTMNHEFAF